MKEKKSDEANVMTKGTGLMWLNAAVLCVMFAFITYLLINNVKYENVIAEQQAQIVKQSKIYVFDMERASRNIPELIELNDEYRKKIADLSEEINQTKDKIMKLKNSKSDASEVYMSSLKMKRDAIVENYEKSLQKTNADINEALVSVSNEINAPILNMKSLFTLNGNVVDVTEAVVQKIINKGK